MSSVYTVPAEQVFGEAADVKDKVFCSLWEKFDGTSTFLSANVAVIGDQQRKVKVVRVNETGDIVDSGGFYLIKTFLHGPRPTDYSDYHLDLPDSGQSSHKWRQLAAKTITWGSTDNVSVRIENSILAAIFSIQDESFIDAVCSCTDLHGNPRPVMLQFSFRGEFIVDKRLRGAITVLQSLKGVHQSTSYPSTGPAFVLWKAFDHWQDEIINPGYRMYCLKSTLEFFVKTEEKASAYALNERFEQGEKILSSLPVLSCIDSEERMQYTPQILYRAVPCSGLMNAALNLDRTVTFAQWDNFKRHLWDLTAICRQELNLEGFVLRVTNQYEHEYFFKCKQYTLVSLPSSWAVQPGSKTADKFEQVRAEKNLQRHDESLNKFWDCVDYSHSTHSLQRVNYCAPTKPYDDKGKYLSAMITISTEGRTVRMADWVETDKPERPLSSSLALLSMLPSQGASIWAIEYPLTGTVHVCGQAYFLTTSAHASMQKSKMLNATGPDHAEKPKWQDHSTHAQFNPTESIEAVNATRLLIYARHQKTYCEHKKDNREIRSTLRYATAMHCFFVFLMSGSVDRIINRIIKYWPTMSALMRRMLVEILMTSNRGEGVRQNGTNHENYHPFRSVLTNKIFQYTESSIAHDSKVQQIMDWLKGNKSADSQRAALKQCFCHFDQECLQQQLSRTFSLIENDKDFQKTVQVLNYLLVESESVLPNGWHFFDMEEITQQHSFYDLCRHLLDKPVKPTNISTLTNTINRFCSFWHYENARFNRFFPTEPNAQFLQSYVYDLKTQINNSLKILREVGKKKTQQFGIT